MSVSFFNLAPLTERWRIEDPFYLTDNGGMAFSHNDQEGDPAQSQAVVSIKEEIRFAPIDKNRRYDSIAPKSANRCDGMLYSRSRKTILFVELKDRVDTETNRRRWVAKAMWQLRSTIACFKAVEQATDALPGALHYAYIANRQTLYKARSVMATLSRAFSRSMRTRGYILKEEDIIHLENVP